MVERVNSRDFGDAKNRFAFCCERTFRLKATMRNFHFALPLAVPVEESGSASKHKESFSKTPHFTAAWSESLVCSVLILDLV